MLGSKSLNSLPPRTLCFRLRLACFEYACSGKATHHNGHTLTLSTSFIRCHHLQEEAEYHLETCIDNLPASSQRLDEFPKAQAADTVCSTLINYCHHDWPKKHDIPLQLKLYWQARGQLTVCNNLPLYGPRIVIPVPLQKEMLSKIHKGQQGIQNLLACQCGDLEFPNTLRT